MSIILPLAGIVVAGLITASVVLFAALASYLALVPMVGAAGAAALTALFLAVLLALGTAVAHVTQRRGRERGASAQTDPVNLLALHAGRELGVLLRDHPYLGNGCSLMLGFAIGASPELRDAIKRMMFR